jgi:hypothetical protein
MNIDDCVNNRDDVTYLRSYRCNEVVRTSLGSFQEFARLVWHSSWPGFEHCEKKRRKYPWIATDYNWLADGYKKHSHHHDSFSDWNVNDFARANNMGNEMSKYAEGFTDKCQQEIDDNIDVVLGRRSSENR